VNGARKVIYHVELDSDEMVGLLNLLKDYHEVVRKQDATPEYRALLNRTIEGLQEVRES
jgi:hypothetical protein